MKLRTVNSVIQDLITGSELGLSVLTTNPVTFSSILAFPFPKKRNSILAEGSIFYKTYLLQLYRSDVISPEDNLSTQHPPYTSSACSLLTAQYSASLSLFIRPPQLSIYRSNISFKLVQVPFLLKKLPVTQHVSKDCPIILLPFRWTQQNWLWFSVFFSLHKLSSGFCPT